MLFNSWEFILFFSGVFILYFSIPYKVRSLFLLIASYTFYMAWKWDYALIMIGVTFVNYFAGKEINKAIRKSHKQYWLFFALSFSLIPLIYFKYANFFIENVTVFTSYFELNNNISPLQLILPVGISFFTFQSLSYSLDVYNNKTTVENNFVNFAVFVAFFPQLVAGPIERSTNLLSQFKENHDFDSEKLVTGIQLFIWGLFKKVVIADRLSLYVDSVYGTPELHTGNTLTVATLFFAIQIYCDFSGYSDMAIGIARMLGFRLMQNFNLPYLASSIADFWKRWHISLSTWFADYLYIPLGGNRVKYIRWILNIFIVFLVSGFWHGAQWTFVIWGGLHALYYLFESWGDKFLKLISLNNIKNNTFYKVFKILVVFIIVCYAWVFFRSNSVTDAFLITEKIFTDWGSLYRGSSTVTFVLSIFLICLLFGVQLLQYFKIASIYFSKSKVYSSFQFAWYVMLLLGISTLGISSNAFIYFQF